MAALLVETRQEMKIIRQDNSEEAETSMFSTILDPSDRREVEEGMHGLFRANYEMIGRDLKADVPSFKARDFPDFERKIDRRYSHIPNMTERKERVKGQANIAVDMMKNFVQGSSHGTSHDELEKIPECQELTSKVAINSAITEEGGSSSGPQKEISNNPAKRIFHRRSSPSLKGAPVDGRGLAQRTVEDVGDAFFSSILLPGISEEDEQGNTDSTTIIPEDTLLNMMEDALESREYGKLDFMASYFKEKSVSQLVILSQARLVWMNDWYPLKDCTYAISVDPGKKEVLVVFRGAITRADWGHAKDVRLKKVPNPVKDDFEGKTDTIALHQGFYKYLFRKRKDNYTTKYDEITNVLHHFGSQLGDYKVVVTGHSLGGALTILFSLWASADERFTKNGPIKMFTFGNPFVAGQSFLHTFRHQEQRGKLQLARFYNERDAVVFMPISWAC
uniref:Fungal lipase-type domain-containing protein n=1 Tax=Odontella aurita TaxID=265563 RepID=A0A7S4HXS5_9STRA|mmetsp:Transcript_16664/g.47980  ORF Transcript_16664/g.47980 Transcript_16664/m.47980 type:complete len:448 (+) Transcript_16664:84-1427(+)